MMKTVLYLAILGLMVHWAQGMVPGERRSFHAQVHQEQDDGIGKYHPRSGWSYLEPFTSKRNFPWYIFYDEEDEETKLKKKLINLEKRYEEVVGQLKKLQQGEPIGEKRNKIENRANSGSMESVEANESRAMLDHSGSSENMSFGSLENLESSGEDITKNEREVMSFSKIGTNGENDSVDPTNTLLPVSQSTLSAVITNDHLTKISLDHEKNETNIGLTNTIMVTESNAVGLIPNTDPIEENNFPRGPQESYHSFSEEKGSAPIPVDDNESSVQDFPGNWESLAISYSNPFIFDTKGREIKDTQVSYENQDAAQDTDDQSSIGFDHESYLEPRDIFGKFLSSRNVPGGTRMEQMKLSNDFERVHRVIHNFEENKKFLETLSYLEKKRESKDSGPYGFFRSLNKPIESNPLVAEADKIFRTGIPSKKCIPCPPAKKEEKVMCVLMTLNEDERKETSQIDEASSTPSVTSTPATDTKGTTAVKKHEVTEKPVVVEPEKTQEMEPEKTEEREPEKTIEKEPEENEEREPEKTQEKEAENTEEKKLEKTEVKEPEEPVEKQI